VPDRVIRISVSAKGRGLQTESTQLNLRPLEDSRAMELYRRLCTEIDRVLKNPFPKEESKDA